MGAEQEFNQGKDKGVSEPGFLAEAADLIGDAVEHVKIGVGGFFRRDLANLILNPLELKIGSVLKVDHALGGELTVAKISRVNDGISEFVDYLLQHKKGEEPEFVKLRVRPDEVEKQGEALILGLKSRTAYNLSLEDRSDEKSGKFLTDGNEEFYRLGGANGTCRTLIELHDADGDRKAELGEIGLDEVRSWAFYRETNGEVPAKKEFIFIEVDKDNMMDKWRGSRVPVSGVEVLSHPEAGKPLPLEDDLIADKLVASPSEAQLDTWLGIEEDKKEGN